MSTIIIKGMLGELYAAEKRRKEENQGKRWEDEWEIKGVMDRITYGTAPLYRTLIPFAGS